MHAAQNSTCRRTFAGLAGLLAVGLLAACGKPDSAPATNTSDATVQASKDACRVPHLYAVGVLNKVDEEAFSAAEAGDVGRIEQSLATGANVNSAGLLKRTPLFAAAFCDRPEAVKLLLDKGSNVNAKDSNGMTPLHAAVIVGGMETAKALLAGGADTGIRDGAGRTPLHVAAATNQTALVELLMERGANAALHDKNGMTAASLATENGHKEPAAVIRKWQERHKAPRQK